MTNPLQLAVAILCFALVSAVELELISKKHDEAQALGVQLEKTSQIDLNKEAMTFAKKCEADCQAIKAKLDKLLPDLIFDVQEELHNTKPESSEGQLFHSNVTTWLQGIVTKLPVENITDFLTDMFTLNRHFYIPYLSHAEILISYAQLIKSGNDKALVRLFGMLPWCIGDTYSIDCGIRNKKQIVWRVDAMSAKIASDGVRKILLISGNRMDTTDSFLSADFLKFIAFACLIELFWPTISEMATGAINLFCMGLFGFIKQRI